jgi:selenide,water dikinase
MKRLLLIGGGHAHVEVLRRFALEPEPGVTLTLASPHRHTPYSGMLPGLIAGHYRYEEAHIDLVPLAAAAGARFEQTRVVALDAAARTVACADGGALDFDVCGIDIGSTPDASAPGARENTIGVKPVDRFIARWQQEIERARARRPERVVVVGGGAGGLEVLLAMQQAARTSLAGSTGRDGAAPLPEFHLVTEGDTILPSHPSSVRRRFMRVLGARNVAVHTNARAERVDPGRLHCTGGLVLDAELIVWATSAAAAPWIRASGLAVDHKGFIAVDRHLESTSHKGIFGSGDIASLIGGQLPKSGVFAVRKGPVLAHNLRASLRGAPLQPFVTKPSALSLITTGDKCAVMSWGQFATEGPLVWRWKDWIDRRFMAKYRIV